MPKGILPAGHLMVSVVPVHGRHVLRVCRPRGNGKYDMPPELLGIMCLQFDTSELIRPGGESRKCVGVDQTTGRYILLEVPLNETELKADPLLKERWSHLGIDLVGRSYELFEQETAKRLEPTSPSAPADLGSIIARAAHPGHLPVRVFAPQRSAGSVSARA